MTPAERLREISFDLYERYVLLERIGRLFPPREAKYRVLDVGGHTPRFWPDFSSIAGSLIPDATVVVLDMVSTSELKNYVQANGVQLPFRDQTFDLVCSLDTLEHIPVERRPDFLAELLRVTRDGLYIAFPFDSPSNRWAESVVMEYTSVSLKHPVQALVEHRQCGLPDRDMVPRIFSQTPHPWVTFNQGNTDVWLLMMLTYHTLRMPGTDFVQELNRRFNQVYAAQDWADPAYRAGYLLSKRRGIADLEAVRIAFHRTERRPDLQSILAFCQLFLNIAQNGRVNVDKDRHIRHIENALADARVYKEKWREVTAVLHNLEVSLLDTPPAAAPGETPAHWPQDRMSHLVDAAVNLRAGVQAERESTSQMIRTSIDGLGSQIAEQQDVIRGRIDALHNRLEFQARLDGRLRDLEIGLVTNRRAVQAIYDSRIWKVLSRAGGWLLRLAGQETPPNQPAWTYQGEPNIVHAYHGATDDFLALVCDYPGETGMLPVRAHGRDARERGQAPNLQGDGVAAFLSEPRGTIAGVDFMRQFAGIIPIQTHGRGLGDVTGTVGAWVERHGLLMGLLTSIADIRRRRSSFRKTPRPQFAPTSKPFSNVSRRRTPRVTPTTTKVPTTCRPTSGRR